MWRIVKLALKNKHIYICISEIILLCSLQCIFTFNCLLCYREDVWYLLNCHVISLDGEERAGSFACLPGVSLLLCGSSSGCHGFVCSLYFVCLNQTVC